MMPRTEPKPLKPEGMTLDPKDLAAGRYGTYEMVQIWGPEKTFSTSLRVQAQATTTLSRLRPDVAPLEIAQEIIQKANLDIIKPERIRELEEKRGHDVIAINEALEEVLSKEAAPFVNLFRTSADTTQSARALQTKAALEVIIGSIENLRDIIIDRSLEWIDVPHMDTTHLYDALPTVAGRPFAHYAEMLQSNIEWLHHVYTHSMLGKWADATGNHHAAWSAGVDGISLETEYCRDLELKRMEAPAQVPGLEFEADVVYAVARTAETLNNIAKYIAWGRSDDVNIFINASPKKKKGSSAMPHKDAKNGNPTAEEQVMSIRNYMHGWMITALSNCEFPYARNLSASASSRIQFEDGFKFLDHGIRRLAETVYWLGLKKEVSEARVLRSYGVVTSPRIMTYLTDHRYVIDPLPRSQAHDLVAKIATEAWEAKKPFIDLLVQNKEITARIDPDTLVAMADPLAYIGESKKIVESIALMYHHKKILGE